MEIISLISGFVSIILGVYAIWFAWKESKQSSENYNKTKELLAKIEAKSELIDRSVQLQQTQLIAIINRALDKIGESPIDIKPITLEEIDQIFISKFETTDNRIDDLKKEINSIPRFYVGDKEPQNAKTGDIWIDTSK